MPRTQWKAYIQDARRTIDARPLDQINRRQFLRRAPALETHWIYRFYRRSQDRSLIHGYLNNYRTYSSFFVRHFAWIFVVFVYVTTILTAMQVGLATERPKISKCVAYRFAVFSVAVPLIITGIAAATFVFSFLYNLIVTLSSRRHHEKGLVRCSKEGMIATRVGKAVFERDLYMLGECYYRVR